MILEIISQIKHRVMNIKPRVKRGIMYIVVMIFNTVSVGRCKLLDLLYGDKKNEKLKKASAQIHYLICKYRR